jgi:signal transduction histidine kinase
MSVGLVRLFARFRRDSLRTQLILWNVVALSLLLGAFAIVSRYVMLTFMMQSVDRELDRGIAMFRRPPRGGPRGPGGGPEREPPEEQAGRGGPGEGPGRRPEAFGPGEGPGPRRPPDAMNPYRPHLFTPEGESFGPIDSRPVWDTAGLRQALGGERRLSTVTVGGEPLRVLSAPAFNPDRRRGAVQYAYPLKDVNRALAGVDMALLALLPVGLLVAGWMGSVLTGRILNRVHRMTQAAGRIGAEDFSGRLPVSGKDEFSELAETFNKLLGRLESSFEDQRALLDLQRRFTADASHELKTPLTVIQGSSSLALSRTTTDEASRHTFEQINHASESMAKLVQDLLLLARFDEGQLGGNCMEMLAVEVLARAAQQSSRDRCAPISVTVEPEDLTLIGNEAELSRLIRNLVDNAVRHTSPAGAITVTARASAGGVQVSVSDTGSGIAAEHLAHLGERFYRVDTSRSRFDGGTGLGLSICRGIAAAHGGSLKIESEVGRGTVVTVALPGGEARV